MPPGSPSLGELVAQGRTISRRRGSAFTAFFVLGGLLTLLIFIGEAVRDAFDPAPDAAMSLVEVDDLSVAFGTKRVVTGVSFTLDRGETLALVGESRFGQVAHGAVAAATSAKGGSNPTGSVLLDGQQIIGARCRYAAPRARRSGGHGVPGADDQPQPAASHRPPGRRGDHCFTGVCRRRSCGSA